MLGNFEIILLSSVLIHFVRSWIHLIFNLLIQVSVGLPLEMVHGSFRICIIYLSGVLAGKF